MEVYKDLMDLWLPRKSQIVMVELLAPVLALWTLRGQVEGKHVLLLVDSEAVEGALVKGYSNSSDICELVGVLWQIALELQCSVYIDRVPTDANPADHPSRGRLHVGEALGWKTIPFEFPDGIQEE